MRNRFANMKQGTKQLIDFFNAKMTMFKQIYPEGESKDTFDIFYEMFLLDITSLELARKIQENNPKNLASMRTVCFEQLAQLTEAKILGLSPGNNPKENFKGKFHSQKVKKTFTK